MAGNHASLSLSLEQQPLGEIKRELGVSFMLNSLFAIHSPLARHVVKAALAAKFENGLRKQYPVLSVDFNKRNKNTLIFILRKN